MPQVQEQIEALGQAKTLDAMTRAATEVMREGGMPEQEIIDAKRCELWLVIGADDVMVPFRPNDGDPKGTVVWRKATGILDFYHAAGHLWEAADAWFGYRPNALTWFAAARHTLRHGGVDDIIDDLAREAARPIRGSKRCAVLSRVHDDLERHREHLRFPDFKQAGLPLGSGFVESACKWLIQQRFKGVGIRWSRDGFNHLLLLRLAWTNDRFDALFQPLYAPSPNL
ncbi:MAG: hypothetical protein ABI780_04390 [Ardenticatenales bacterium]